jgi:hypothetical protein
MRERMDSTNTPALDGSARPLSVGDVVAERYCINAVLGEGGVGVVYRVEHLHLRKQFALKVLLSQWLSMPDVVARFEREAGLPVLFMSGYSAAVVAGDASVLRAGENFVQKPFVPRQLLAMVRRALDGKPPPT